MKKYSMDELLKFHLLNKYQNCNKEEAIDIIESINTIKSDSNFSTNIDNIDGRIDFRIVVLNMMKYYLQGKFSLEENDTRFENFNKIVEENQKEFVMRETRGRIW